MRQISKIGFWSGVLACIATVSYCLVQLLQLYSVLTYPFDEILIYTTSLLIVLPFLALMLALHYSTAEEKRIWSHMALTAATLYAVFVTANYVVQLATVIPQTMKGKLDEVRILQQTPHSMFWNFDALGYLFMGLACLAAFSLFRKNGFEKWVRYSLLAHAAVTPLISIVYFFPDYSYSLLLLGLPWAVSAPLFMLMLALWFRKRSDATAERTISLEDTAFPHRSMNQQGDVSASSHASSSI